MKTIEWIKAHELSTGGIEAWAGLGRAYPECTGYLIPTLLDYGERELAERLGDWLESIQHPDGSFDGLDGIPHAFDTAAIMEGLKALGRDTLKAQAWMETQRVPGGLAIHAGTKDTEFYNFRALAIMGVTLTEIPPIPQTRTHYLAYALEGFYNTGLDITEYLKPYANGQTLLHKEMSGGGSDTSATAQIAILCIKNNIPCHGLIDAVREQVDSDGGVFHDSGDRRKCSWTAKFYLDMEHLLQKRITKEKFVKTVKEIRKVATDISTPEKLTKALLKQKKQK